MPVRTFNAVDRACCSCLGDMAAASCGEVKNNRATKVSV